MSDPKQKMEYLIKSAAGKAAKNDWEGAFKDYSQAIQISPTSGLAQMKAGECCVRLGKTIDAVRYLSAAARKYAEEGTTLKAIAVYKSILKIDPNAPGISDELARLGAQSPQAETANRTKPGIEVHAIQTGAANQPDIRELLEKSVSQSSEFSLSRRQETVLPKNQVLGSREKIELFHDLSYDEFRALVNRLKPITFLTGDIIIKEGDTGDSLYVITTGQVSIFRNDEFGKEIWIGNLEEGSFFGEFGFFSNARRFASVKADVETTVLELTKGDADAICLSHPGIKNVLMTFYKKRVLDTLLAASPLFSPLTPPKRAALLEHFTLARYAAGNVVIKQGTQGQSMYIIQSGNAKVITRNDGGEKLVSRLLPGDFFGEVALLTGKPRTADVIAETDLRVMEITRDILRNVVREYPEILETLKQYARTRL
jgi:CRP-like cAMP-binding protein